MTHFVWTSILLATISLTGVFSQSCDCGKENTGRIVGGKEAMENQFPFMCSLIPNWRAVPFCGGSIISESWVLTAAHCTDGEGPRTLRILVGHHDVTKDSSSNEIYSVSQIVDHPRYNRRTLSNDISLIKTGTPMTFSANVARVCLPKVQPEVVNAMLTVIGWGALSHKGPQSTVLMHVDVMGLDIGHCVKQYGSRINGTSQICASTTGGKDSCQGDSGGPLNQVDSESGRHVQVGVVSFGIGCANGNSPAVYSAVFGYIDWISNTIGKSNVCNAS